MRTEGDVVGWSTNQLADLAGTTLRTIRHYHEVGLLAEPERQANGYKSYGVPHLVRVLRIKRLTGLGLSLTEIADLGDEDAHPGEALRRLDAELAATIERLQRTRAELALILREETPTDLPPDIAATIEAADLSAQDRTFTTDAPRGEKFAMQTMGKVMLELYNRAQIDVLIRMNI